VNKLYMSQATFSWRLLHTSNIVFKNVAPPCCDILATDLTNVKPPRANVKPPYWRHSGDGSGWNIAWTGRKLRLLLLRKILERDVSLNHFINSTPNVIDKKVQIFFQKPKKRRLATSDLKW